MNLFVDREGRQRRSRRDRDAGRSLGLESLEGRTVSVVTATFIPRGAVLIVTARDNLDNTITVSRDAGGTILVNNGQVTILGGTPTVDNTSHIIAIGAAGNDTISLDETNGALPFGTLVGDAGNDIIIGGSANDIIIGGIGDDLLNGGPGQDVLDGGPGDNILVQ
jgi:Ca2+-binding RTX toxin-like protein